jgi:DNA (cytosine-5)-methyltransferase 1
MKTRRFSRFRAALRRLGYQPTAAVKDAQYFGVAQRRRRLILLAAIEKPVNFAEACPVRLTVRNVIGKLPPPRNSQDRLHRRTARRSARIERLIRLIPKSGGSRVELPRDAQLACHQECTGFKDVYGRMSWDDVAPTITGGCFNPSKGRFLHPVQHRAISLREAAMLQGFPRSYRFPVSAVIQELATAIGNALPPEFIRRHAEEVKKSVLSSRARG